MKNVRKEIRRDCRKAMTPTVLIYVLKGAVMFALTAVLAELLGGLADAVFSLSAESTPKNIILIALCVLANGLAAPMMEVGANALMLRNALAHDRMVFKRWLEKDWLSAMAFDRGEVEDRMEMDPINYRIYWVNSSYKLIGAAIMIVPLLFLVLRGHPFYGGICAILAVLRIFVPKLFAKREADFEVCDREYSSGKNRRESELTSAPCELRLLGLDGRWKKMLLEGFETYYRRTVMKKSIFLSAVRSGSELVKRVIDLSVIMAGAVFVASGAISPGGVAVMLGYFGLMSQIADNTAQGLVELTKLSRFEERMELFYTDRERSGGISPEDWKGISLKAEEVSLFYGDEPVFSNLSFNIECGEKVALTGKNGSGKTSLIRLISGLVSPTDGRITANGTDIGELDSVFWRNRIAVAMQQPWLLQGTVKENVLLGNVSLSEAELDAILEKTGLWELRNRDARDGTEPLSGGEKQRISIARALARRASVLILDEPTNHMDAKGIETVENIISSYAGTVIAVTHEKRLADRCQRAIEL